MRDKSIYHEDTSAGSRYERERERERERGEREGAGEGGGRGKEGKEKKRETEGMGGGGERNSRTADAAATKSGHSLKFTSAHRARTLSGESPHSSPPRADVW